MTGNGVNYLFAFILVMLVVGVVGDGWFIRALRSESPAAFVEAGKPNVWLAGFLPPMLSSQYSAFIIFRKYKHFLPPGSKLRLAGNLLYVAHVALPALVGMLVLATVVR